MGMVSSNFKICMRNDVIRTFFFLWRAQRATNSAHNLFMTSPRCGSLICHGLCLSVECTLSYAQSMALSWLLHRPCVAALWIGPGPADFQISIWIHLCCFYSCVKAQPDTLPAEEDWEPISMTRKTLPGIGDGLPGCNAWQERWKSAPWLW